MKSLNLGILAHVDAGKTSLTERLLYTAGAIDEIGSVDAGNTQTDNLTLERQRGITIKSAVTSFVVSDTKINLIDTPGHPDFIAEVERVLSVLDGVILVISAAEGVQSQTRILMRTLQRLGTPTLLFVNKVDRMGARYDDLLLDIAEKLTPNIVAMGAVERLGAPVARYVPFSMKEIEAAETTHPVFFGSAITGAGVSELFNAIPELLPAAPDQANGPVSATIFKIERDRAGEKIAYLRLFSGAIRVRDKLNLGQDKENKVTSIRIFDQGTSVERTSIAAGEIGQLRGLRDAQIGDVIGHAHETSSQYRFAPPTLEAVIEPTSDNDRTGLRGALTQLAEQDPLINLSQDAKRNEFSVSLYGEVQKEVIQATLADDFGINVQFKNTKPICIERPRGKGEAIQLLQDEANPTSATVGLRVEPGPPDSGIVFKLDVLPRFIPLYIYKTSSSFAEHMQQYIQTALQEGLSGWKVTDCAVTLTDCNYYTGDGLGKPSGDTPRTTAGDFRKLTPLVVRTALEQAGTIVCEPICKFKLEVPVESFSSIMPKLAKLGTPQATKLEGSVYKIMGDIPAARIHELQQELPGLTGGEGLLEYDFNRYESTYR